MSRINIEDKLWSDARFDALKNILGSELLAIGMVVKSFRIAQDFWKTETQLVPFKIWDLYDFSAMEKVGLADRRDGGVYIKGSIDQFSWLKKKQEAGKKSAEIRREKFGSAQPNSEHSPNTSRTLPEHLFENPRTPPEPPTPTPSLNKYNTSNAQKDGSEAEVPETQFRDTASADGAPNKSSSICDEIVSIWNETLGDVLPKVTKLTDKRKKLILAQVKKTPDISDWQTVCDKVKASDFLSGKSSKWKCVFDWILNENNRTKILEGNYDNEGTKVQTPSRTDREL